MSADEAAGKATYRTTAGWYAGCTSPRMQLMSTQKVRGVGDEAMLFVLRDWNEPTKAQLVGVARTGTVTTTTSMTRPGAETPDARRSAELLATAVNDLCGLPGGGSCAETPDSRPCCRWPRAGARDAERGRPPPVAKVTRRGSAPSRPRPRPTWPPPGARRRTFGRGLQPGRDPLVPHPGRRPAAEFGLTQTVGALPRRQAEAFVDQVRRRLASCPDRDLTTQVAQSRT